MPTYKKFDSSIPEDIKLQRSLKKDATKVIKMIDSKKIQNLTPYRIADNWSNIMTGLGSKFDKTKHTTFSGYTILDDQMLAEIWIGEGLGKTIVEDPANEMTREWITIENDPDNVIETELERLNTRNNTNLSLCWMRLFGGGLTVIGINDGGELQDPVKENKIQSVDWLKTYDRTDCSITEFHFNQDPQSKNYRELEYLTIQPQYEAPFNCHISRMLLWKGLPVPHRQETGNFYFWGMSELQSIWNHLSNLCGGMQHVLTILYSFIVGKYKLDGLAQMIAEGNKKLVEDRMAIIELGISTIQGVLIDKNEDYERISSSIAGVPDTLDRYMMLLSGVSKIPVSRLFGRSAAGMNATGEGDEKNYYNYIKAQQENRMKANLIKLVNYINISIGNKIKEPKICFNPLFQMSQKEELECKQLQAIIDKTYIDAGVLLPEEVAENRFGGCGYSYDTKIDLVNRELPKVEETEEGEIPAEENLEQPKEEKTEESEEENE